ncbi:MAG: aminodeoxychorismate/anthranilate synthase component II [Acidobacteria bacterium]|nr:aminodeoxychorismate/anthranilate synthase component II [Acidobacteriota bacterium]
MILVIDNYDSFTYNLVQLLSMDPIGARQGIEVVRNDAAPAEELLSRRPAGIVLSPGPGRPESAGVCLELLRLERTVPVLGVCLGHQALGQAFGGEVVPARELMHGKTSQVRHGSEGPFEGLPNPFEATRYHSLVVREESLPTELEPLAWSEDGTLMGMRHRRLPYWGVQFHPESILTASGPGLLANFLKVCEAGDGSGEG